MKWLLMILTSIGLSGCNSTHTTTADMKQKVDVTSLFNHSLFTPKPVQTEAEIFALPESEQQAAISFFGKYADANMRDDQVLGRFLDAKLDNFSYDGETLTATEATLKRAGNCISLAVLTQAYANVLGIKTSYAKVDSYPMFRKHQEFIITSSHFKTKLFANRATEGDENGQQTLIKGTVVDYFPDQDSVFSGNAQYEDLVAKFYTNLAVSTLLEADYDLSYSLLSAALKYAPRDAEAINTAALYISMLVI